LYVQSEFPDNLDLQAFSNGAWLMQKQGLRDTVRVSKVSATLASKSSRQQVAGDFLSTSTPVWRP